MAYLDISCSIHSYDSDTDIDEMSDGEISKLLIVTQTPNRPRKHEGFDRTGDFTSRAKISQDLARVINDGLYYYEEGLWHDDDDDEEEEQEEEGVGNQEDGWVRHGIIQCMSFMKVTLVTRLWELQLDGEAD